MTIVAYSQGWGAPLFQRTWGVEPAQYAVVNGLLLLAIGPATVNFIGWLSDRGVRRGIDDMPLQLAIIGAFVLVVSGVAAPLMPSAVLAYAVFAVNTVGIAMISATGVNALLNIVPGEIRAQAVAFYYMTISLAGLLLGPTTIGLLTDNVVGEAHLDYAMAILPLLFGLPVLLLTPLTRRRYRTAVIKVAAEVTEKGTRV